MQYDANRLSESTADLKRLEQVRLQDNREAANDFKLWEEERSALNKRIAELIGPGSPDVNLSYGHALHPITLSMQSATLARRGVDDSVDEWRDLPIDGLSDHIDELRSKLVEVRRETDRQVQHAAEADEIAHHWFVQTHATSSTSRESLSAEVVLLHAHIASNGGEGANGQQMEMLLDNFADYADRAIVKRRLVRILDAWAHVATTCKVMRDSFDHLYRGFGIGTATGVMNALAVRMRENTSAAADSLRITPCRWWPSMDPMLWASRRMGDIRSDCNW